jgi:hypothetical protein
MYPNGDEVQTVELWKPPDTWSDLSIDLLNRILTAIDAGLPNGNRYSDAPNVIDRAAWKVVVDQRPTRPRSKPGRSSRSGSKMGCLFAMNTRTARPENRSKGCA